MGALVLALNVQTFAVATALIAFGWLILAVTLGRRFRQLVPADTPDGP